MSIRRIFDIAVSKNMFMEKRISEGLSVAFIGFGCLPFFDDGHERIRPITTIDIVMTSGLGFTLAAMSIGAVYYIAGEGTPKRPSKSAIKTNRLDNS